MKQNLLREKQKLEITFQKLRSLPKSCLQSPQIKEALHHVQQRVKVLSFEVGKEKRKRVYTRIFVLSMIGILLLSMIYLIFYTPTPSLTGAVIGPSRFSVQDIPTITTPVLNSTNLTNRTSENLTVNYSLATSATKGIVEWSRNGNGIAFLMSFEGSSTNTLTKEYITNSTSSVLQNLQYNNTGGYDGFGTYNFDANSNYIQTMTVDIARNFTITTWVKSRVANQGGFHRIIESDFSTGLYLGTDSAGTGYKFIVANGGSPYGAAEGGTILTDRWQFLAVTYNTTHGVLYIDGSQIASDTFTLSSIISDDLWIGKYPNGAGYDWNGFIDEVVIWNRSLSATQIQALYENKTNLIVSSELVGGQQWTACITPVNATADGQLSCSNTLTVANNNPPALVIDEPLHGITYNRSKIGINYHVHSLDTVDTCSYSFDDGITKTIIPSCNNITMGKASGKYNVTMYANDTDGRLNTSATNVFTFLVPFTSLIGPTNYRFNETAVTHTNTYYNETTTAMMLTQTNSPGNVLTNVYDVGSSVNWKNITWVAPAYGTASPSNQSIEMPGLNMSQNRVLLHLDNNSAYAENASYWYDFSGNRNNATCTGSACPIMSSISGRYNRSLYFDGNDVIALPSQSLNLIIGDQFTFMFWANPGGTADLPTFGFTGSGTANGANPLGLYDSGLNIGNGPSYQLISNAFPNAKANTWTHFTLLDNGTNYVVYVNGTRYSNTAITYNPDAGGSSRSFGLGQSGFNSPYHVPFIGNYDEIIIFNRSLTPTEIVEHYKRGILKFNVTVKSCSTSDCSDGGSNQTVNASPSTLTITNNRYIRYNLSLNYEVPGFSHEVNNISLSYLASNSAPTLTNISHYPEVIFENDTITVSTLYTDTESDSGTVRFMWYQNGTSIFNQTNTSIATGTNITATLSTGNFSHFDLINVTVIADDGTDNSSQYNSTTTIISNSPPTMPILGTPISTNTTVSRTPWFRWNNITDIDNGNITYNLLIDDNSDFNNPEVNVSGIQELSPNTSYNISTELNVDTTYFWRLRAYDNFNYSNYSATFDFTINSYLALSVPISDVQFGVLAFGQSNDTTDDSPPPFRIENVGNIFGNVTITANNWFFTAINTTSMYYQFQVEANKSNSFNSGMTFQNWTNMTTSSGQVHVAVFDWHSIKNDFLLNLNITVPSNETAGPKNSTITFTMN